MSLLSIEHAPSATGAEARARGDSENFAGDRRGRTVAVWGAARLRPNDAAAPGRGDRAAEEGSVRFDGRDLAALGEEILGREIGYCQTFSRRPE